MSAYEMKRVGALAIGLLLLPVVLQWGGLTYSTVVECLVLAMAGLALNILLGHTGLVSFGHGAWFGIDAKHSQTLDPAKPIFTPRKAGPPIGHRKT